jgi:S-sulfo-L-cysteine synthase (3-phospho-L-serine-dependent)
MRHFVLVESNTTGTGRLAVQRLLAAGERVSFLTRSPERYPFLACNAPRLAVHVLETNEAATVTAAIHRLKRHSPVDAVLTFSDFYVTVVAQAAARCRLRGLSPEAARTCRDKHATRRALRAAGLHTPDFWLVSSEAEARRVARLVSFPCVVKPPSDSSSHGVRRVSDAEELLAHVRVLSAWRENVRGQRLTGSVLVESLIEGREYSVETMTRSLGGTEVIGVTDKHLSDPPHFVELGHDFPSAAPAAVRRALSEAAVRALAAVGYDFGPAHTEVRWTAAGPVVVEINARLAGGMIPELVAHATGVDLVGAWFDLLLGADVDLTPRRRHVASIRFLTAPSTGRLVALTGVEEATAGGSVREVTVSTEPGVKVRIAEDAYDRLGFVIGSGPERRAVEQGVAAALERIHLVVEEEEGTGRELPREDALGVQGA